MGLASKSSRLPPTFNTLREKDNPFNRYERYARVQAPGEIKYTDLKEMVEVDIGYESFPVRLRKDYLKLNDAQVLVPITVGVGNKELTYRPEGEFHVARVAVYGAVTSISNRLVTEFEDELVSAYSPARLSSGIAALSLYQKLISLEARGRYRIDLIVKDVASGKVGAVRSAIVPPQFPPDELSASSLIFSSKIERLREVPEGNPMFVLGELKIHPNVDDRFVAGSPVGVYLQLYNFGLDSSSLSPLLQVNYTIVKDAETVSEVIDEGDRAVFSYSPERLSLVKALPVTGLLPGKYQCSVRVLDKITDQELEVTGQFEIEPVE